MWISNSLALFLWPFLQHNSICSLALLNRFQSIKRALSFPLLGSESSPYSRVCLVNSSFLQTFQVPCVLWSLVWLFWPPLHSLLLITSVLCTEQPFPSALYALAPRLEGKTHIYSPGVLDLHWSQGWWMNLSFLKPTPTSWNSNGRSRCLTWI